MSYIIELSCKVIAVHDPDVLPEEYEVFANLEIVD